MLESIRGHWAFKILAAILAVVILTGIIHTAAMNLSILSTFNRHFGRMGAGMQAMMGGQRSAGLYDAFRAAVNDSLVISALAALLIAGAASLFLSRLITKPVQTLTVASQRIAQGEYHQRIPDKDIPRDELGLLARSFNTMAERLEETEVLRRQLIGDISHELRTPLTAIKGSMEGLIDGVLEANEATYSQIYRDADRLQRLVEDLQELSRVEAGQFSLDRKPLSVAYLLSGAVESLKTRFDKKGVALTITCDDGLPSIQADRDRLLQVLQNLLDNALRFTPKDGRVTVTARKSGQSIQISVEDNGAGIESKHLPFIFERFYRADQSRSRVGGVGSGIGLTISKTLVEAHGGSIWAESGGKEEGTCITFSLPLDG
jgi:histidine kinase